MFETLDDRAYGTEKELTSLQKLESAIVSAAPATKKVYVILFITTPFNNMQNLKFISPPMVAFFTAVNQQTGCLRK